MAILKGLVSIMSELKAERTNLVNQLKHVDPALSVLGRHGLSIVYSSAEGYDSRGSESISTLGGIPCSICAPNAVASRST
jgi:hypothetical protein